MLPPSKTVLSNDLVDALRDIVANPSANKQDAHGLRFLVAFFADEQPRLYPAPDFPAIDKGPTMFQTAEPATNLVRADIAQSVEFQDAASAAAHWIYINGTYYRI